ncbi:hypothetical protein F5X99DRAFT_394213 [Biscogniauxia marginata]|nr:hypothetical protein F5X99DRAFT_394213 [Biscogniauxia marginata]
MGATRVWVIFHIFDGTMEEFLALGSSYFFLLIFACIFNILGRPFLLFFLFLFLYSIILTHLPRPGKVFRERKDDSPN